MSGTISCLYTERKSIAISKRSHITGIFAGIMLNSNFLSGAISQVVQISNIFILLLVFCAAVLVLVNRMKLVILKAHAVVVTVIVLQLLYGKIFVNSATTDRFILSFIGVGIPCLIISLYEMDIDSMMKSIVVACVLALPYYITLLNKSYTVYNSGEQMGIAYSILPGMMAAIYLFFRCPKLLFRIAAVVIEIIGILLLFKLMTRGAYLCFFVFVIGYIYCIMKKSASTKKLIILCMVFIGGIWLLFVGDKLLASSWFNRVFGVKATDFLNGREADFAVLFQWRSMVVTLFGTGVGSFQKYEYTEYLHNLFGQIYYEQGLICAVFVLFLVGREAGILIRKAVSRWNAEILILMLFCMGIIRLMVSYYFWIDQFFWITIWLMLGNRYQYVLGVDK